MSGKSPRIATLADVERIEATPLEALDLPPSTYRSLARSAAAIPARLAPFAVRWEFADG